MSGYSDIEEGLRRRELFLEYLPFVELATGCCVGAEALIRWRRPACIVQPLEFLDRIEDTYVTGALAYYVLEELAHDLLAWLNETDAFLSFNVPPEIVGRGGLHYVLTQTGLWDVRHKLIAEIVERGVLDRLGIDTLNRVSEAGLRLALDDVGIAGANPVVLARCHVDMVKLDRRLVAQVHQGQPLPCGLAAIATLLQTGGITTVAEGVESAEQVDMLLATGVRLAQGFYFSPPLSAAAFKAFFAHA